MTLLYTQGFEGFPTTLEDRTDLDVEFDFHNDVADAEAGITAGRTGGNASRRQRFQLFLLLASFWVFSDRRLDHRVCFLCGFQLPEGGAGYDSS